MAAANAVIDSWTDDRDDGTDKAARPARSRARSSAGAAMR